jgi:DNA invertase Pin-like site-specific DNA recombinase
MRGMHAGRLYASFQSRRVPTVELQRDALLAAGVGAAQLYDDHASGRTDDRPGLSSCLKALRDGDTLVVWKLIDSGAVCITWSTLCTTSLHAVLG